MAISFPTYARKKSTPEEKLEFLKELQPTHRMNVLSAFLYAIATYGFEPFEGTEQTENGVMALALARYFASGMSQDDINHCEEEFAKISKNHAHPNVIPLQFDPLKSAGEPDNAKMAQDFVDRLKGKPPQYKNPVFFRHIPVKNNPEPKEFQLLVLSHGFPTVLKFEAKDEAERAVGIIKADDANDGHIRVIPLY
jgi:hypothetical protein